MHNKRVYKRKKGRGYLKILKHKTFFVYQIGDKIILLFFFKRTQHPVKVNVFHGNVRNISGNCLSVLLTSVKPVLRGHH